jgi:hypothetical protein
LAFARASTRRETADVNVGRRQSLASGLGERQGRQRDSETSQNQMEPSFASPAVHKLGPDDVQSFKALRAEVCVASEFMGDVWIVPKYSTADREEISIEHLATLTEICEMFPGAKVVAHRSLQMKAAGAEPSD